jgi:hypothetical protein
MILNLFRKIKELKAAKAACEAAEQEKFDRYNNLPMRLDRDNYYILMQELEDKHGKEWYWRLPDEEVMKIKKNACEKRDFEIKATRVNAWRELRCQCGCGKINGEIPFGHYEFYICDKYGMFNSTRYFPRKFFVGIWVESEFEYNNFR